MKRSSLLKRFLDVFGRLMSKAERNSADEILHVRRILQHPAQRRLHPSARRVRGAQNWIFSAMPKEHAILGVAHQQTSVNIATCEIRSRIEFAGIARTWNFFGDAEQLQVVAEFWNSAPVHHDGRGRQF